MTNGYPYEMLLPCWCGDRPIMEVHDNHYWVSCSCESWKHDMQVPDYPEVGCYSKSERVFWEMVLHALVARD